LVLLAGIALVPIRPRGLLAAEPPQSCVDAEKCKMCHSSATKGVQFTKWSDSAHAKSFATLASEESKKIAAIKGIADPQQAEK